MSRREFEAWVAFYRMEPFDDMHRFHRPAALVAHSMGGAEVSDLLHWLQPRDELDDIDRRTMRAFGLSA
jgi:hypothetical protein